MKNKYYALVDQYDEIVSLDDKRQFENTFITVSCSAVYPSKIEAERMKKLLEDTMKKKDVVTIKEVNIK